MKKFITFKTQNKMFDQSRTRMVFHAYFYFLGSPAE